MPKMHKHWVYGKKWQVNIMHPIAQKHRNIQSQVRHDLKTGKLQRWARRNRLKLVDATYNLYIRKIIRKK